ncbi:MAG: YhdP family protein [Nevskiales bacterium]
MRRWEKRLWSSSLVGGSVVLIIAAVLMGAVRLIDLTAPRYRQVLANRITEAIEQPVEVGSIGMSWRRLRPTVELNQVLILHPDNRLPVFRLASVQVPFKWSALLRAEFEPAEVILNGMDITLEWRPDGSVGIKGIDFLSGSQGSEELDLTTVFAQLRQLGHVEIRDSELAWLDLGGPVGLDHVSNLNAELLAEKGEYSLNVEADLPAELGSKLRLQAYVQGEAKAIEALESTIDLEVEGLSVQAWLQPVLQEGLSLRGGPAQVEIHGQFQGLQPRSAQLILQAPPQASWRDAVMLRALPGLNTEMTLTADESGWETLINSLQYRDATGPGPTSTGKIEYRPLYGGFGDRIKGELDRVRVQDLLAWSSVLTPSAALPLPADVDGELQQMQFSYERTPTAAPKTRMQAQLKGFSMPVTDPLPGISGLNGKVEYRNNIVNLILNSQNGEVLLPQLFSSPLPLTQLDAEMQVQPTAQGWSLQSKSLSLQSKTVNASGGLGLELFSDERMPAIDLKLNFSASDVMPAKPLIPLEPALPSEVGEWLQASILGGRVPQGEFVLRGPLDAFPYAGEDAEKGEFRIEFDVENGRLEYAPGWPQVTEIEGHAVFAGLSMQIKGESGKILGVPVNGVKAGIADFREPDLLITGSVEADLQQQLMFLAESPLREDYAALLEVLKLRGPGALDLALTLPLANIEDTSVRGVVFARGGELDFEGLPYPVTELKGAINFTGDGLSGEGIQGRFLGVPATAKLSPQTAAGADGSTQLEAVFQLSLPQHTEALKSLIGEDIPLSFLHGETAVRLRSRFGANGETSKLQISSDLKGMHSRTLKVGVLPAQGRVLVDWNYIDAVHGQIELLEKGGWQLNRGVVRLGPQPESAVPPLPMAAGWDIRGDLPLLDIPMIKPSGDSELPSIRVLDVHVGRLQIAQQSFRDLRARLDPAGNALQLTGPDTEGRIQWSDLAGRKQVNADFRRVVLSPPKQLPGQSSEQAQVEEVADKTPLNPARFPGVQLAVEQLMMGDEVLGQMNLKATAIPDGLRLESFSLQGKKLQMGASGQWVRSQGNSSAKLKANFETDDITDILKAVGYAPHIVAKSAIGGLDVLWAANPKGLQMDSLNGEIGFKFKDGSLLAVEPGAGRVLSLVSFYSIPRRLTLDFRDVMGEGTAFDKLEGSFKITDGNAYTSDLEVESPSIEIDVDGRVGLAARDYDQVVTIQPELSSSVAFAGAVIGGPVLGLGLWLAQELLDEPLEQATILRYRLTGSWDNPVIEPLEAKKRKPQSKPTKPGAATPGQGSQAGSAAPQNDRPNPSAGPRQ